MKPNDKALDEALSVTQIPEENMREYMRQVLTAAYAAQFQSEDYAELIARLRKVEPDLPGDRTRWHRNPDGPDAADAIEALQAERDALHKWKEEDSTAMRIFARYRELEAEVAAWKGRQEATAALLKQVEAERDALLARLAHVDDKALVEIARQAIIRETNGRVGLWPTILVAAIAAIRPHIEAGERERCAKIADEMIYADEIAEEIRSGK